MLSGGCTAPASVDTDRSEQDHHTIAGTAGTAMCHGSITDTRKVVIPVLPKPDVNVAYTDPALGATVIRITDSVTGEVHKPAYSTMQAWNSDESLLLLYRTGTDGNGHQLRDGHTYEFIHPLLFSPADLEEAYWSHSNPDELFYVSAAAHDYGQFRRLNPRTNESELIADFSQWCGTSLPVAGSDVHMQSLDDDQFGFRCRRDDGNTIMFSYRISTGRTIIQPTGNATPWSASTAPTPTASGTRYWLQGKVLDNTLEKVLVTPDLQSSIEHSTIGSTSTGQDALYQVAFGSSPHGCDGDARRGVGHLVQHNLETGDCRNIISEQHGYPYPTSSTHLSALAHKRPGWVALSSIGSAGQARYFSNQQPAPALFSEIYLTDTNPQQPVTCRLAHHRSTGKNAVNGRYAPYFGEPHATISPSGTRIVFGSDWYDSGAVDSYVIELPGYTRP